MGDPVLAFDLGGTKILAALVQDGSCGQVRRAATPTALPVAGWLDAAVALAAGWQGRYGRAAIAVSGLVADGHWSAVNPGVLAIPKMFPLVAELRGRLGVPVVALNDGHAAAWGEYRFGAGQGCDIVFVTVSTGIGGGIVSGGQLLTGHRGVAGHLGRLRLGSTPDATMLEDVASGSALGRVAAAYGDGRAEAVFSAAAAGAAWAVGALDDAVDALAGALASLQALLDPDRIVLGGGVGLVPDFAEALRQRLAVVPAALRPTLVAASLAAAAGLAGVADYATSS